MEESYRVKLPYHMKIPGKVLEAADGDELVAGILYRRGFHDPEKIRRFLYAEQYQPFDPAQFPDIGGALALMDQALRLDWSVAIYGDYDVDGVTATSVLLEGLSPLVKKISYHVPDRFTEGYGMNKKVIQSMAQAGVQLIITCDCGISNHEEIALARSLGMKVLITDHHTPPPELPAAEAVLNPKLLEKNHPLYGIPGVAMAYLLVKAVYQGMGKQLPEENYLDLVSLGIIADVVPLEGESRYLLKRGMPYLLNPRRVGLKALYDLASQSSGILTEEDIAFQLAPRVNAAGRLASARLPVDLLTCKDAGKAGEMAEELEQLNARRKEIQNRMIEEGVEMVEHFQKGKGILVLYKADWHHGVIGIAAGRLAEEYQRPVICLSLKEDGETVVGSARSVEGISIYDVLAECSQLLMKFGGHAQAAGLSLHISQIKPFTRLIQELMPSRAVHQQMAVEPDVDIKLNMVNEVLYERIRKMAPFGEGFSPPVFESCNVQVVSDRRIGSSRHHRMVVAQEDQRCTALWWWGEDESFQGRTLRITYTLNVSEWKSARSLNLVINGWGDGQDDGKAAVPQSKLEWVVREEAPAAQLMREFPESLVFYDGLRVWEVSTVNRYQLRKSDSLILLSIPPTPDILREVLFVTGAKRIVLGTSFEEENMNVFLRKAMGVLKHVMARKDGRISLLKFSSLLGASEGLAEVVLKYLSHKRMIHFQWEDEVNLLIQPYSPSMEGAADYSDSPGLLYDTYHEMLSFQRYIFREGQEKVNEIMG